MKKWSVSAIVYLAFLAALCAWRLRIDISTPYLGATAGEIFVEIPRGASSSAIADVLVSARVLRARLPFLIYLRWTGDSRRLQAGEYRFAKPASPAELAARLVRGDIYYISVTIPEGLTAQEALSVLAQQGLGNQEELAKALLRTDWIRDLDEQAESLEGYLFPDTYRFPRKVTCEAILLALVGQFRAKIAKLLSDYPLPAARKLREVVILASMIEKEAKSEEERELVASVFTNRLSKGMPLACDPTIIYALKRAGKYDGNIRKADLAFDSPYNTYLRAGLPPGPVANPGESSLRAALSPKPTDYLYFVSRNDGTHFFAKDFRSHAEAVARYQKKRSR